MHLCLVISGRVAVIKVGGFKPGSFEYYWFYYIYVLLDGSTCFAIYLLFFRQLRRCVVNEKLSRFRNVHPTKSVLPLAVRSMKDMHLLSKTIRSIKLPLTLTLMHSSVLVRQTALSLSKYSTASTSNSKAAKRSINFDTLGTWDSRIELPLELEASIDYGRPIPKISAAAIGLHSLQGRRPYNEDQLVVKELRPNLLYLAVFDGHGGSECADFCYHHMEDHIRFWIDRGEGDYQKILDAAFLEVNNSFGKWWAFNGKGIQNR